MSRAHAQNASADLTARTLTAAVLIAGVLAALWWLPVAALAALLGAVVLLAAWEWSALAGLRPHALRVGYVVVTLLALLVVYDLFFIHRDSVPAAVWWIAVGWWMAAAWRVARYQWSGEGRRHNVGITLCSGWLILLPAWMAVIALVENGPGQALVLLLLIWVADSTAYFFGRRFGRRRLASRVSPGKSWEGFAAALIAAAIAGYALAGMADSGDARFTFVAVALVTVLFSLAGDLAESLYKRLAGMKNSGALLPGHGGVMDRIDSLTAAAPVFALGVRWLEGS